MNFLVIIFHKEKKVYSKKEGYTSLPDLLNNIKKLPAINWNISFFGGHTQNVKKNWEYPREKHVAFELIYVINGKELIRYDHYKYILNEGDFIIISPGNYHFLRAIDDLNYFCFHFDLDEPVFEEQLISNSDIVNHSNRGQSDDVFSRIFFQMISTINYDEDQYRFSDKIKLEILFSRFLLELDQKSRKSPQSKNITSIEYAKALRIYIKKEMEDRVSSSINNDYYDYKNDIISDICNQMNLSNGYASRIFKKHYNITPRKYLGDIKQEIAKKLILKPQFTINQISNFLGYTNITNFSRQFKIWTGYSPRQFRIRNIYYFSDKSLFSNNFKNLSRNTNINNLN
ncbi:Transcriptional regulator, AraC family [Oenococcus oeni]|uniref:helix-turn-helix domain-containing protein n=1 Tax=Oenococcus oeni TaxID=1247 RepID=UPI0010BA35CF|nr:AraC family transcriptional regulator [Oenococcus oeni]SYW12777.1 Transcriptional regulator, AraC family [Oenococcus oeni]